MAKRTRKMGKDMSDDMSAEDDMTGEDDSDESEKTPKRRVKKVTVTENYAKGGLIKGCGPAQVSGKKFSGTF